MNAFKTRSDQLEKFFNNFSFTIPGAATVDLMVPWIGPKWSANNSDGAIGPIP